MNARPPASIRPVRCQPAIRWTLSPLTTNTCPVTCAAASEASHATTGATFAGSHSSKAPSSGSNAPSTDSVILVRARGAMAFTVTPYLASSRASTMVMEAMPALAAA